MGLRSILDKVYNTRPILAIRKELNRKIDNKINEYIQPLNSAVAGLGDQLHDTKNALDGRIMDAINLMHRTINEHDQIIRNQDQTLYPGLHASLYPAFHSILQKICGSDHRDLMECAHLLLLEITKNYHKIPGGIWQLDYEIGCFTLPPPPAPEQHATAPASRNGGPLKILVVSGMFPSIDHGGGLRLFDIIDQLGQEHEIDLYSIYTPALDHHSFDLLRNRLAEVKLVDEPTFHKEGLLAWLTELGRTAGHYDVIQCEYPLSAKLIPSVRGYGKKIGFTFMECVTKSLLIKLRNSIVDHDFTDLGRLAQTFWEFAVAELTAARETDFRIAVTEEDAETIIRISGVRPEIIPTCLSPSEVLAKIEACHNPAPEEGLVTFLGYYNHFPNLDGVRWYLNNVHAEVQKAVPGYRFLVVGAGDTSALQKISGSDPSVIYTGRVDDITPHILRGKVCILPLISGAGIRGKLNQYSAAGRPSVTTTIGNLGLNYEDGTTVLIADTPAEFAAAVIRLLTDHQLNQEMAKRAQAYAMEHFTWGPHLNHLVEIYRR